MKLEFWAQTYQKKRSGKRFLSIVPETWWWKTLTRNGDGNRIICLNFKCFIKWSDVWWCRWYRFLKNKFKIEVFGSFVIFDKLYRDSNSMDIKFYCYVSWAERAFRIQWKRIVYRLYLKLGAGNAWELHITATEAFCLTVIGRASYEEIFGGVDEIGS